MILVADRRSCFIEDENIPTLPYDISAAGWRRTHGRVGIERLSRGGSCRRLDQDRLLLGRNVFRQPAIIIVLIPTGVDTDTPDCQQSSVIDDLLPAHEQTNMLPIGLA